MYGLFATWHGLLWPFYGLVWPLMAVVWCFMVIYGKIFVVDLDLVGVESLIIKQPKCLE